MGREILNLIASHQIRAGSTLVHHRPYLFTAFAKQMGFG